MSQVSGEQFKLVTLSLVFHWVFLEKLARACRQWKTLLELVNLLGFCRILVVLVTWSFSNVKLIPSKAAIRKASTRLQCFSPPCLRSSLFLQCSVGYKSDLSNGKGWQGMSARNWKFGGCPPQPFREKITLPLDTRVWCLHFLSTPGMNSLQGSPEGTQEPSTKRQAAPSQRKGWLLNVT